jgi:glyoxylase-like metal-dependent hydrolase (beta-lactamase superfamily II)
VLIGQVRVEVVSDGIAWHDAGAAFGLVPRVLWQDVVQPDSLNRIPFVARCLLIWSAGKTILVDTGYGDKLTAKKREHISLEGDRRLLGALAELGVRPEHVDIIVNTHLHSDHCGGNTLMTDGRLLAAFPRAGYWVQRRELADARYPNERTRGTYFPENFAPLEESGQLHVVDGDAQVTPEVRCWVTPGHTRSHQAVVIESEGESAVWLGDACGWAVSMERLAWVPAYDVEPMESIETKRRLREWAHRTNAVVFFQQDAALVAGRVRCHPRAHEGYVVEPVETVWP